VPTANYRDVEHLLPLSLPVFHILLALTESERHGYALKRAVLQCTEGRVNLGSGALYGSIQKMLEARFIEESEERPDAHLDDERRRYYRITSLGQRVVEAEAIRLRKLVRLAESRLVLPKSV
jgi:DNA-binding PadR family transcriptional regulator